MNRLKWWTGWSITLTNLIFICEERMNELEGEIKLMLRNRYFEVKVVEIAEWSFAGVLCG